VPFEITDQIRRHLIEDRVLWLTTVSPAGRPIPRPIWFFWDGSHILIYSLNTAVRLVNIRANELVSVHFNSTVEVKMPLSCRELPRSSARRRSLRLTSCTWPSTGATSKGRRILTWNPSIAISAR